MGRCPPLMGFEEERYVEAVTPDERNDVSYYWTQFYTCIANGQRVFVWAWKAHVAYATCCMVVIPNAMRGESDKALRDQFRTAWMDTASERILIEPPCDELLLQATIHKITMEREYT